MRVKVTRTKKIGIKARIKEAWSPYYNTTIIKEKSNGTRNVKNVNFSSNNFQVIPSSHKILEKYNEQTWWNFCNFAFLDPKVFYLSDFKKMQVFLKNTKCPVKPTKQIKRKNLLLTLAPKKIHFCTNSVGPTGKEFKRTYSLVKACFAKTEDVHSFLRKSYISVKLVQFEDNAPPTLLPSFPLRQYVIVIFL